ncbi:hypothetical protein BJY00DRAFT_303131 [Aspergillus carlsbadensis]|nr:hypothetical protein BJY00DRAFT_303131 [Aspergillus carlsbadensis]
MKIPHVLFSTVLYPLLFSTLRCTATLGSEPFHNVEADLDLVSMLNLKVQRQDAIFTEAVELLKSAELSPSCNRMAAGKLVTTCQSIGRKPETSADPDMRNTLDYVRSLYAARLAICEITGAGTPIPSSCLAVNASPSQKKGFWPFSSKETSADSDTENLSRNDLEHCLQSLESRPQWWTSYSNSRQNAVVICQASRAEKEKEEILELYKTILESSDKMNHGLWEALRMAAEESARYKAFAEATERLKNGILRDLEESKSTFQTTFEVVAQGFESRYRSLAEAVTSTMGNLQTVATGLEKDIQSSSSEVNALRQTLKAIHNETLRRSDEVALTQKQNTAMNSDLALSLKSQLQSVTENEIAKLGENVVDVSASLEWLYGRVGQILEQGESASKRLRSFESSLDQSQLRVESIHKTEQQVYEIAGALSQLIDGLQTQTKISTAFIEQGASKAADLVTTIDEGSRKYQAFIGIFEMVFGSYSSSVLWMCFSAIVLFTAIVSMTLHCACRRPLHTSRDSPTPDDNKPSPTWFDLVA